MGSSDLTTFNQNLPASSSPKGYKDVAKKQGQGKDSYFQGCSSRRIQNEELLEQVFAVR